jgi:serine/threonine protein kinase
MAPEQIAASRAVGPEADQYAFGCVLYEAIAKQPPFDARSLPALAAAKATGDPPHISIARPDLPVALGDAIARSMTRDPAARWPSMDALCDALDPFVGDATIPWIPAPIAQVVPSVITPTIDVPRAIARPVSVDTGVPETRPPSEPSESMLPSMDGARPAHLSLIASKPPAPSQESPSSKSAINRDDPTKKVAALKGSPDPIDAAPPATPSSIAPVPESIVAPSPWRAVAIGLAVLLVIALAFVATR